MAEIYQKQPTEEESLAFELGQEVTFDELRRIVAPQNTKDPVEDRRLQMVGTHVNELLRKDLPPCEVGIHQTSLYNLGAEVMVEYLPQR